MLRVILKAVARLTRFVRRAVDWIRHIMTVSVRFGWSCRLVALTLAATLALTYGGIRVLAVLATTYRAMTGEPKPPRVTEDISPGPRGFAGGPPTGGALEAPLNSAPVVVAVSLEHLDRADAMLAGTVTVFISDEFISRLRDVSGVVPFGAPPQNLPRRRTFTKRGGDWRVSRKTRARIHLRIAGSGNGPGEIVGLTYPLRDFISDGNGSLFLTQEVRMPVLGNPQAFPFDSYAVSRQVSATLEDAAYFYAVSFESEDATTEVAFPISTLSPHVDVFSQPSMRDLAVYSRFDYAVPTCAQVLTVKAAGPIAPALRSQCSGSLEVYVKTSERSQLIAITFVVSFVTLVFLSAVRFLRRPRLTDVLIVGLAALAALQVRSVAFPSDVALSTKADLASAAALAIAGYAMASRAVIGHRSRWRRL